MVTFYSPVPPRALSFLFCNNNHINFLLTFLYSPKTVDLNTSSELQMPATTGGEDELRQSAGSPLSPSMSSQEKVFIIPSHSIIRFLQLLIFCEQFGSASVADRLKLRRALVNETHRISPTPIHPNNDPSKSQSPLHSPLIGDHKVDYLALLSLFSHHFSLFICTDVLLFISPSPSLYSFLYRP